MLSFRISLLPAAVVAAVVVLVAASPKARAQDITPPEITIADITVPAGTVVTEAMLGTPTVVDEDPNVIVTNSFGTLEQPVVANEPLSILWFATDAAGNSGMTFQTVLIAAPTDPLSLVAVTPSKDRLWVPNLRMEAVTLAVQTRGGVGEVTSRIIAVESNGPSRLPAFQITGPLTVHLRRVLNGCHSDADNRRVYTITVESTDAAGNTARGTAQVRVWKE